MPCAETRLQAYFDGEVDALAAADVERHIEGCAECRAAFAELQEMRSALKRELPFVRTPPELAARLAAALDQESALRANEPRDIAPQEGVTTRARTLERQRPGRRAQPFWMGAFAGIGGAALAAGLAWFLILPAAVDPMLDDLVNAHVRSLMPAHLIDVESTDRHTVKPWFAGHADVSPAVADFAPQGYRLIGGRADYFERQRAAVVVYQHGAHVINVFSWSAGRGTLPANATRNGYHLAFWKVGNLDYCAVADTGWEELLKLETLLKGVDASG
jgi:anti-sigma factor RsiW